MESLTPTQTRTSSFLSDTSSDDPVPSTYELNSLDCNYWDSPNISKFLVDNNNNNSNSNLLIHFNI